MAKKEKLQETLDEAKSEKRKLQEMLEDTKEENERLRDESFAKERSLKKALKKAQIEERCKEMIRGSLEENKKELKLKEKEQSQTLEENRQLKESVKNVRLARQNMQA